MDMDNDYGFIFQDINRYYLCKFNHDLIVLPHWNESWLTREIIPK